MSNQGPKGFFGNILSSSAKDVERFLRANSNDRLARSDLRSQGAQRDLAAVATKVAGDNDKLTVVAKKALPEPPQKERKDEPKKQTYCIAIAAIDRSNGDKPLPNLVFTLGMGPASSGLLGTYRRDDLDGGDRQLLGAHPYNQTDIEHAAWEDGSPNPPQLGAPSGSYKLVRGVTPYRVQRGETLHSIADKAKVTPRLLAAFNWGAPGEDALATSKRPRPDGGHLVALASILYRRVGAVDWGPALREGGNQIDGEACAFGDDAGIIYLPVAGSPDLRELDTWATGVTQKPHELKVRRFAWPQIEEAYAVALLCQHCARPPIGAEHAGAPRNASKPFWVRATGKAEPQPSVPLLGSSPLVVVPDAETATDKVTLRYTSTLDPPPRLLAARLLDASSLPVKTRDGQEVQVLSTLRTKSSGAGKIGLGDECSYDFDLAFPKDDPIYGPKKVVLEALSPQTVNVPPPPENKPAQGKREATDVTTVQTLATKYLQLVPHFQAWWRGVSPYSYAIDVPGMAQPVKVALAYPHKLALEYKMEEAFIEYKVGAVYGFKNRGGLRRKLEAPLPTGEKTWAEEAAKKKWVVDKVEYKRGAKKKEYDRREEEQENAKAAEKARAAKERLDERQTQFDAADKRRSRADENLTEASARKQALDDEWSRQENKLQASVDAAATADRGAAKAALDQARTDHERAAAAAAEQAAQSRLAERALVRAASSYGDAKDDLAKQKEEFERSGRDKGQVVPNKKPEGIEKWDKKTSAPLTLKIDGEEVPLNPLKHLGAAINYVSDLVKLVDTVRSYVPKIGLYFDFDVKVLEGSLLGESGWTEQREPPPPAPGKPEALPAGAAWWWSVQMDLTVFSLRLGFRPFSNVGRRGRLAPARVALAITD